MSAQAPQRSPAGKRDVRWTQGYYCAVALALREEGCASALVRSLFVSGGDASLADPMDIELFVEHGLMAAPQSSSNTSAPEST
ncbi:hypothetical protein ABIC83_002958 [Roseateles asaccharophilus]